MNVFKSVALIIFLHVALVVCKVNVSLAEPSRIIELLKPTNIENISENRTPQDSSEVFINRTGHVTFAAQDVFGEAQPPNANKAIANSDFTETELVMSFFPEQEFRILVDSESRPGAHLLSLGGRKIESNISTFSMTLTNESYLVTFQDLDNNMVYKVVGDMKTGIGKVSEIDLEKLPPVYDSEPITPPME